MPGWKLIQPTSMLSKSATNFMLSVMSVRTDLEALTAVDAVHSEETSGARVVAQDRQEVAAC